MESPLLWLEVLNLKEGVYEWTYSLNDTFFKQFEHSIIEQANLTAQIQLRKTAKGIDTKLYLVGEVVVPCDLCADDYPLSISTQDEVIYRYTEHYTEEEQETLENQEERELRWISAIDKAINIGQEFYEIASIELPLRIVPPEKDGICTLCHKNPQDWLSKIGKFTEDDDSIDPRWEDLKKFKK